MSDERRARHELKCWSDSFRAICNGSKTYELRRNDRNFHVGDVLVLREWNPDTGYTGGIADARVRHIITSDDVFGELLAPGACVMAIEVGE